MPCPTFRVLVAAGAAMCATSALAQPGTTPRLSRAERSTLQAVVAAVDAAAAAPDTADVRWQTHLLRTSDGAHYLAFTVEVPDAMAPQRASALYVRLATKSDVQASLTERSAVMEWLRGMRSDPLVAQKRRGIAFGEMPVFGAGSIAARGPGQQAGDLALLALERERAREQKEAAEKARRAALEGTAVRPRDAVYPFEDFTVDAPGAVGERAAPLLRRSITAGPGEYDLYVAWAVPAVNGRPPAVHVVKRALSLPPAAGTELTLSSVILADEVTTRATPHTPDRQSRYPYAIGTMEILPARDDSFTNDERLAVVLQVVNARADQAGKPDVSIAFQLFRVTPAGEQSVGRLNPQFYNAATLPADFDLTKGHPVFAAMAAPLRTLPRGEYRLKVTAADKLAGRSAAGEIAFRVVATPATLLATAPIAVPISREVLLEPAAVEEIARVIHDATPSPALASALEAAREARFVELLREDAVDAAERPARTALRGLGLFALGDPRMACTILRQSTQETPNPGVQLYLGACRALDGNDRDAITEWQKALDGGVAPRVVVPLLVDAHLRLGDLPRAQELAERLDVGGSPDPSIARALATLAVAQGRDADAVALVDGLLRLRPDDREAQYALLHALFAGFVHGRGPGATPDGKARLQAVARTYIEAKGRHAGIVREWLEVVTP